MRRVAAPVLVAGLLVYLARRREGGRERVRLYYDDGSMVTLGRGRPEAQRLFALARDAL